MDPEQAPNAAPEDDDPRLARRLSWLLVAAGALVVLAALLLEAWLVAG